MSMSVSDMVTRSAGIMSQMQDDQHHIMFLRQQAKRSKDVIKVNCVNDKVVQVNAEMNIADAANEKLQADLARNNDDRFAQFSTLQTTGLSIKRHREEASSCVGEPELYKQEAGTTMTRPEIPDDPTWTFPYAPETEPPGYASPYQ